jgi:hypothetical protein
VRILLRPDDGDDIEILITPNGVARVRRGGEHIGDCQWTKENNTLEIDGMPDLSSSDLTFYITTNEQVPG